MSKGSLRRMPSSLGVIRWWMEHHREQWPEHPQRYDWGEPVCWGCRRADDLERCHLVDHALGGPDDASNLVLLCGNCHGIMPMFHEREAALRWVQSDALHSFLRPAVEAWLDARTVTLLEALP